MHSMRGTGSIRGKQFWVCAYTSGQPLIVYAGIFTPEGGTGFVMVVGEGGGPGGVAE